MNERRYYDVHYTSRADLADILEELARTVRYERRERLTKYTSVKVSANDYNEGFRVDLSFSNPPVSIDDNGVAHSTEGYDAAFEATPELDTVPF